MYTEISSSQGQLSVSYSKFCDLWNQLCPFIVIMRPATDLCWTCQKNNNLIQKTANLPETQKAEAVRAQEEHLRLAAGEREIFTRTVAKNQRRALTITCKKLISVLNANPVRILELSTIPMTMHSSFITLLILISQGPFTSRPRGNAPFLMFVAKLSPGR